MRSGWIRAAAVPTSIVRLFAFLLHLVVLNNQHPVALAQTTGDKKGLCVALYLMADNDLESFIRNDFKELLESNLIKDPAMTTWVYFDALNLGTEDLDWGVDDTPLLENLFYRNGTSAELNGKFEGSRYFTYSHDQQRIIVDTVLDGEQNSDNSSVLYDFAVHALQDCVQSSKGSQQEFVFAFSSHGGGYAGFGGDLNQNRRRLSQNNVEVAGALSKALQDVEGAPAKFDLVGFDSCLMQAMGAIDDYQNITKLYLASEAVVPGHGTSITLDAYASMSRKLKQKEAARSELTNNISISYSNHF